MSDLFDDWGVDDDLDEGDVDDLADDLDGDDDYEDVDFGEGDVADEFDLGDDEDEDDLGLDDDDEMEDFGDLDEDELGSALADSVEMSCPYCAAEVELVIDPVGGGSQEYVEDCEVCCQPWSVRVTVDSEGTPSVDLSTLDEA